MKQCGDMGHIFWCESIRVRLPLRYKGSVLDIVVVAVW